MDLEDLQTFVEVADSGGVSPAARRLGIAKSVVSRRLSRLEEELGVQLLSRNTRGASLTEAGTTFREHASKMCAAFDLAREEILPAGELRGRLRIALPSSFGPTHFAPVIAELARRHQFLQVHAYYSDKYVDLIGEGFDCAIRVGYLPDSNLIAKRIGAFSASIFANPGYIEKHGSPKTPDEISGHDAVLQGTESWKCVNGDTTVVVHPQGRFKADSAFGIAEGAAAGLGVAALPDVIAQHYVNDGRLVRVMEPYHLPNVGIYVVRPPGQHLARKLKVLVDLLVEKFGKNGMLLEPLGERNS